MKPDISFATKSGHFHLLTTLTNSPPYNRNASDRNENAQSLASRIDNEAIAQSGDARTLAALLPHSVTGNIAMLKLLKHWFDPTVPVGSTGFTIIQVVGLILESVLRRWIWTGDATTKFLLLVGAMVMFAVMAITTAKRLLDVCRSRWWTGLITGLVLLDILSAIHAKSSPVLSFVAILCVVLSVGYLALIAVLIFEKPAGGRGPGLKTTESTKPKNARSVSIGLQITS